MRPITKSPRSGPSRPAGRRRSTSSPPRRPSPAAARSCRAGAARSGCAARRLRSSFAKTGKSSVRRLGPHDLVVQDVALGLDLVARHDRALGVAEQARVHPREVAEVGEVLDLARGVAAPLVRAARHRRPPTQLGHLGQRQPRLLERDPDEAEALDGTRSASHAPSPGRASGRRAAGSPCRHRSARSASRGTGRRSRRRRPAQRQRRPAVDAEAEKNVRGPGGVAPDDQRLAEQLDRDRRLRDNLSSTPPGASRSGAPDGCRAPRATRWVAAVRPLPRRGRRSGARAPRRARRRRGRARGT